MLDKSRIKKILVISLSNIGDIVLTFPVIDILKRDFPQAQMDVVLGPKGESLVKNNPAFRKIYLYHKGQMFVDLFKWLWELAVQRYDLVIDLRNTAIPFLIFAKQATALMVARPRGLHMRQQHLARLRSVYDYSSLASLQVALFISEEDKKIVEQFLGSWGFFSKYVVIAPGSRAENKRWREDGFAKLADHLVDRYRVKVVFLGDESDVPIVARIKGLMKNTVMDLAGKLTLAQSAYVLTLAKLAIVNDSAPMHLASYLNVPVAAFFGPTDPKKYGPWSQKNFVVRGNNDCCACRGDKKQPHQCLQSVVFADVVSSLENFLTEILSER